ncbi:MAG: SWIM zinc finger family protein [Alicyclobacillus sp.]|nr:SWIM zinc finger family protein [Alicyclobacillus sp.]
MSKGKVQARLEPLESRWRKVLERLEGGRFRRGRVMERQGQVIEWAVCDGWVSARVQGPRLRSEASVCTVTVPCPDWRPDLLPQVAELLAHRPEWMAGLFSGEWHEAFWDAVTRLGVSWYPAEDALDAWWSACRCSCDGEAQPCLHVAAVIYTVLREMEVDLFTIVRCFGLDSEQLADEVHRVAAVQVDRQAAHAETADVPEWEAWPEEAWTYRTADEGAADERGAQGNRAGHRMQPSWSERKCRIWSQDIGRLATARTSVRSTPGEAGEC